MVTPQTTRNRIRGALPWLCFGLAIIYGARQTARQRAALEERGEWITQVTEFMDDTSRDSWSYDQTVSLLRWIAQHERLPTETELPQRDAALTAPLPPQLYVPNHNGEKETKQKGG